MEDSTVPIVMDAGVLAFIASSLRQSKEFDDERRSTLELEGKIWTLKTTPDGKATLTPTLHTRDTWTGTIEHWNGF